jgi:non-specific serine/threonine protein kinase
LRATLNWSYRLLSQDERAVFRRLSVFAGGWTIEAAEAVCSGGGIEEDKVLDLLGGLVDKSLVVAKANTGGGVRHGMLEPIRQYALENLEEGLEGEEARRHHARFYLALAEDAEPGMNGPDRLAWLQRLRSEQDNMRAALTWTLEREEAELALRLAGSVRSDWSGFGEVRGWLEAALGMGEQASVAARLKALSHLKWFTFWQGDFARAEAAAEESLALSRQTGDTEGVVASLRLLAAVAIQDREDYGRATKLYEEGIPLCRECGYMGELAQYLADMAEGYMHRGDFQRAKDLLEEAAALIREKGTEPFSSSCSKFRGG